MRHPLTSAISLIFSRQLSNATWFFVLYLCCVNKDKVALKISSCQPDYGSVGHDAHSTPTERIDLTLPELSSSERQCHIIPSFPVDKEV